MVGTQLGVWARVSPRRALCGSKKETGAVWAEGTLRRYLRAGGRGAGGTGPRLHWVPHQPDMLTESFSPQAATRPMTPAAR